MNKENKNGIAAEVNRKITLYNADVVLGRTEAFQRLDKVIKTIKPQLENRNERKNLGTIIYPEKPIDGLDNNLEASVCIEDGALKIEEKSFGKEGVSKGLFFRSDELRSLIYKVHPKVIIDLAKQLEEK